MSIIGRTSIREAVPFFERGLRATESVVRLTSLTSTGTVSSAATGWFVTPRLILTMAHAFGPERSSAEDVIQVSWTPRAGSPALSARARFVWRGEAARSPSLNGGDLGVDSLGVALLELEGELVSSGFLSLNLRRLELPDDVYVLQFHGKPPLLQSSGEGFHEQDRLLFHDADTQPGASGAPLFNEDWQVIGVHVGGTRAPISGRGEHSNFGLTLPWVIEQLRAAPQWKDIAPPHRLLGNEMLISFSSEPMGTHRAQPGLTESGSGAVPTALMSGDFLRTRVQRAAAVRWSFVPDDLHPAARRLLAMEVSDPDAPRWSLRSEARTRILRAASLEELREARGADAAGSAEQQVLDRILQGPPFRVEEISEDALSSWLPAVRWFSGSVSGLPSAKQVAAELEARRLRGRLQRVVGPRFEGRTEELARLEAWRASGRGPFVVSGLGGVGKSALVARFILASPEPFVWFDFDSTELAPDDAPTLLVEMLRQLRIQLPSLQAEKLEVEDWRKGVDDLGGVLPWHCVERLVLVLDSFESAQYEGRHAELWPFLEALSARLPGLRILVSGRVPLPRLTLGGASAEALHLSALDEVSARAWLETEGIRERSVVETVLSVTRKLPLNLRLAIELVKGGDPLADLSKTLPEQLIQGYLYRRILRRVSTESLRRLARGALVLRRLTADMVYPVLGKACSLDEQKAREDFTSLAGELSLVEGSTVLRHRPDVRNAVLSLLEAEDAGWVRSIEQEAVRWYTAQDTQDPDNATELVYHLLRLGDLHGAEQAWLPGVASRLGSFALEELPPPGRGWLEPRLHVTLSTEVPLEEWEQEASVRFRDAVERELWPAAMGILKVRRERSAHSPLVFLEAYAHWKQGHGDQAREVLAAAGPASGPEGRNRDVLRACLAEHGGRTTEASRLLEPYCHPDAWAERNDPRLEWMAAVAARVRLAVDLGAEQRFDALYASSPSIRLLVSEADLVMPYVQELLEWPEVGWYVDVDVLRTRDAFSNHERVLKRYLSRGPLDCQVIHRLVDQELEQSAEPETDFDPQRLLDSARSTLENLERINQRTHSRLSEHALLAALMLVRGSTLRWRQLRQIPFLPFLYDLASGTYNTSDPELAASVLAQAAPFHSPNLTIEGPSGPLHEPIAHWLLKHGFPSGTSELRVRGLLNRIRGYAFPSLGGKTEVAVANLLIRGFRKVRRSHWILAALHLAAPSPLPRLVDRLVEIPD